MNSAAELPLLHDLVVILEYAYARSPANKCLLFVLARCYAPMSLGACVADCAVRLRVKAIQWDSIGYVSVGQLSVVGMYTDALEQCKELSNT